MSASAHDRAEKTPTRYHRRYSLRAPYPIAAPTGTAPNASNAFSLLWLLPACDLRLSVFVAWILRFASLRKATSHVRIFLAPAARAWTGRVPRQQCKAVSRDAHLGPLVAAASRYILWCSIATRLL